VGRGLLVQRVVEGEAFNERSFNQGLVNSKDSKRFSKVSPLNQAVAVDLRITQKFVIF
jgi:hypothetical protein